MINDNKSYLISFQYDGSGFRGLVKQPNEITILECMEKSYFNAFKEKISLLPAGRTDAGVHALDQKASFNSIIDIKKIVHFWNMSLPNSILINNIDIIEDSNFHVRFSVQMKTYEYKINFNKTNPFMQRYCYNLKESNMNLEKMKEALNLFTGEMDFYAVSTKESNVNTIREIRSINVYNNIDDKTLSIKMKGRSFLRHMVRRIVGVAIAYSKGIIDIHYIKSCIDNKIKMKYIAPANGLYLIEVLY